jgi:hypothetical protein
VLPSIGAAVWGAALSVLFPAVTLAQARAPAPRPRLNVATFLAGAAVGLGAHELGHVTFDLAFDARPGVKRVSFRGLPFFAITHHEVSPRREFAISSAGFWVQHATSEWILTRTPDLRDTSDSFEKGWLAFNVMSSAVYSAAAFTHGGPPERDTRGMAGSLGVDEGWVGAMILGPAVLDAVRYFKPRARWAVWTSRGLKVGLVLLAIK